MHDWINRGWRKRYDRVYAYTTRGVEKDRGCGRVEMVYIFRRRNSFSSPLHDISIFVNANRLRNSAVHPGWLAVVFLLFPTGSRHGFVLLAKLIQPDSSARLTRDDLRLGAAAPCEFSSCSVSFAFRISCAGSPFVGRSEQWRIIEF